METAMTETDTKFFWVIERTDARSTYPFAVPEYEIREVQPHSWKGLFTEFVDQGYLGTTSGGWALSACGRFTSRAAAEEWIASALKQYPKT